MGHAVSILQYPTKNSPQLHHIPTTDHHMLGLGGLGVTCSPRDSRFGGSNPAEVDGFSQDKSSGRGFKTGAAARLKKKTFSTISRVTFNTLLIIYACVDHGTYYKFYF